MSASASRATAETREAIRVLLATRAQAITFRTRAISALHALVTSAPDGLRERLRTLPLGQLLQTCAGLRDSSQRSVEESATVLAMRTTARRALACEREAAELEVHLDRLVRRLAPELLGQLGIGPVVAGQIITSWSHHGRIRSEAAFAKLGGAAPIEASSGTVTRHRLNRSGDRQLNRALHTIVLVRMRQDSATKDYVQRRLAQGKTIRDIKRCLIGEVSRVRLGTDAWSWLLGRVGGWPRCRAAVTASFSAATLDAPRP